MTPFDRFWMAVSKSRTIPLSFLLTIPFVALTFIAVGLTGYLSFSNGRQAVNEVAAQLRTEITREIEQQLATFLETSHLINHINAGVIEQGLLDATDPKALQSYFWQQVQVFETVTSIYFGNPAGGLADAGREGADGFLYVIETEEFAAGTFSKYATNPEGAPAELILTVPSFDARTRPWYTRAIEAGGPAWSDIYILFTGQDMAIAASHPVYEPSGRLAGVVSNDIFLSHLSSFLQNLNIGRNGEAFIVEESGLLVASSTDEALFRQVANGQSYTRLSARESQIHLMQTGMETIDAKLGPLGQIRQTRQFEFAIDGQWYLGQVTPFSDEYGLRWWIVVIIPEADFMARIDANNRTTIALILLTLSSAVGGSALISRRVSRPLLKLHEAAGDLATGQRPQIVPFSYIRELDELSTSFNTMAQQLSQTLSDLNTEISERKLAQAEKDEAQAFLQKVFDTSPNLSYIFDLDEMRITFQTEQITGATGYTANEITAMDIKTLQHLNHPDDLHSIIEHYDRLQSAADGEVLSIEYRTRHRDGSWRWFYNHDTIFKRDDNGRVQQVIGTATDITELKQIQGQLHDAIERFRVAIENSYFVPAQFDRELRYQWIHNPHPDFDPATVIGKRDDELDINTGIAELMAFKAQVIDEGVGGRREICFERSDGIYSYDITIEPLRDAEGNVIGATSAAFDITTRKQAQQELEFQKTLLERQLEASPDGLLIVSNEQAWLYHNQQLLDMWGIPPEIAALQDSDAALDHIKHLLVDPDTFIAEIKQLHQQTDQTDQREVQLKDGRIFERHTAPVISADGVYYGRLWSYRDLTQRKQLEERLRQSQKMEAIGRLAGGIAHDFNNILVPIMGYVEMALLQIPAEDELHADLKQVLESSQKAATLIHQILAFSRNQVLEMTTLDLNAIVVEFQTMIERVIGEDIALQTVLETRLYSIYADKGQMGQVLMNLAVNARDAMPNGGKLTFETANVYLSETYVAQYGDTQPPGHYAMLAVTDTGEGMDAQTLEHIFEPFFTTKELGKGTGLGLATVFGIVKQHEGNIWVSSEPGQGTTFKIYLPRAKKALPSGARPKPAEKDSSFGTETILVVEDEVMVRKIVCESLAAHGYRVLEAEDTADGLRLAQEHATIHLLLSDVIRPDIHGYDLYEQVAAIHPDIKVMLMSDYTDNVVAPQHQSESKAQILQKPFTIQNLIQKTRETLEHHHTRKQ